MNSMVPRTHMGRLLCPQMARQDVTLGVIANGFVRSPPRGNRGGHRDGPGGTCNFPDLGEFA